MTRYSYGFSFVHQPEFDALESVPRVKAPLKVRTYTVHWDSSRGKLRVGVVRGTRENWGAWSDAFDLSHFQSRTSAASALLKAWQRTKAA